VGKNGDDRQNPIYIKYLAILNNKPEWIVIGPSFQICFLLNVCFAFTIRLTESSTGKRSFLFNLCLCLCMVSINICGSHMRQNLCDNILRVQ